MEYECFASYAQSPDNSIWSSTTEEVDIPSANDGASGSGVVLTRERVDALLRETGGKLTNSQVITALCELLAHWQ